MTTMQELSSGPFGYVVAIIVVLMLINWIARIQDEKRRRRIRARHMARLSYFRKHPPMQDTYTPMKSA